MSDDTQGASTNERLLAAARQGLADSVEEILESETDFDINCTDGLGNTPLHLAVAFASHASNDFSPKELSDFVDLFLYQEGCDVDPTNRLDGATPLHLAVQIEDKETRKTIVEALISAGADTTIKNKRGETVHDYDYELIANTELDRTAEEEEKAHTESKKALNRKTDDIAREDDEEPGSGSDKE